MKEEHAKKKFSTPNTFVVISIFIMIATALTWLIPSGVFERAFDEATGRTLVVLGTADETLDWWAGARAYAACRQVIIPGGDHRISNIGAVMPRIMDFILNEG